MATITINDDNFEKEVIGSELPVLVDFYASWCMPCRMLAPVLESLSSELDGTARIGKVNVGDEPELAERYHIRSVPTMLLFRSGRVTDTLVGAVGKEQILGVLSGSGKL